MNINRAWDISTAYFLLKNPTFPLESQHVKGVISVTAGHIRSCHACPLLWATSRKVKKLIQLEKKESWEEN